MGCTTYAGWLGTRSACVVFALAATLILAAMVPTVEAQGISPGSGASGALGDDAIGHAAGDQYNPYIERGGDMFLAVWVDERTVVPGDDFEYPSYEDVYAARLDSNGDLLDATPIIISQKLADQFDPRASWNGTHWLVTWETYAPDGITPRVLAVRVDQSGAVLDDPPIEVDPAPMGSIDFVASGSDGDDWIVLLKETYQSGISTETVLVGARISDTGTHLGPAESLFHPECCYFFSQGDLAYADGVFLLVMECIPDIYAHSGICGLRITPSLNNLDGYPFEIALTDDVFKTPNAATNGSSFFAGWDRYVTYPPTLTDPYAARVTTGGVSLDHPDGIELWGGVGSGASRSPKVAWDGTNWVAAWTDDAGARVARIATDGTVLDPGGVLFPGMASDDITQASSGVRIIWEHSDAGGEAPFDVSSAYVSDALAAGPVSAVAVGAPAHHLADVAMGAETMLAFRSDVSGEKRIMVQSASDYTDGGRAEPVALATGQGLSGPEIAYNGSLYFVVWALEQDGRIYGRRLLGDGTILDDPPISVMLGGEPDVAAVGDDFLVVGTEGTTTTRNPYGVRVRGADGAVLDGTPILLGQSFARCPKVAGMSGRWLATWERRHAHDAEEADVWASFVETDGTTPGEFGVATNQATSEQHYAPGIGSSGAMALITWEDDRTYPGDDWNIYGRRVLVTGDVYDDPDGFPIATREHNERRSAVGWNGINFQVVYETSEEVEWFFHTKPNVWGSRVEQSGVVLEPHSFAIEESPTQDVRPAVAGGGGTSVVVSSLFRDEHPYVSYRLEFSELGDGTSGIPEDEASAKDGLRLLGAHPNPARHDGTAIDFVLSADAAVAVRVYDVSGRLLREIDLGTLPAGRHGALWDGLDAAGRSVAAGVYLYRINAGGRSRAGKIAILR